MQAIQRVEETRGWRSLAGYQRDLVSLNLKGESFLNISGISGADSITDGRAAVFGDFDNDGDSDIFLNTYTAVDQKGVSSGRPGHLLFRNNLGDRSHFLRLTLVGEESGRDAAGAVVRLQTQVGTQTQIKASGSGFMSAWDSRLLFGLDDQQIVPSLEIQWPSGKVSHFSQVPANRHYRVTEGSDNLALMGEEASQLGGRAQPLSESVDIEFPKDLKLPAKPTVLALFTTWCPTCPRELKALQNLKDRSDYSILGLSLDGPETRAEVAEFLTQNDIRFPMLNLDSEQLEALFPSKQMSVPTLLFLDAEGKVQKLRTGWSRQSKRELEIWLREKS